MAPNLITYHRRGSICLLQGNNGTGKIAKMAPKNSLSGKTQGIWKFCKTQGFHFAQVVNALILKVKDIAIFAAIFFIQKLDRSTKSVLCMY